jgi:hypothetical protein
VFVHGTHSIASGATNCPGEPRGCSLTIFGLNPCDVLFKRAKKVLGIRSLRNGFGDAGEWLWRLERQPASPVSKPLAQPPLSIEDTYAEALGPEEAPADVRARSIPSSWIDGGRAPRPPSPTHRHPTAPMAPVFERLQQFLDRGRKLGWARG